ncbi:MAG: periplasmic heavy metal sensor [candidate division Zixibacteria bacterium]|nr:periplasmic heavy metal sensor [candidate division Zixibacteria bacterium]
MKRTILISSIAGLVILLIAAASFANFGQHKKPGRGFGPGPNLYMIAEELELSDQQIDKIKEIRLNTEKKLIDVDADIARVRLEMRELWMNDVPSENAVNKLIDRASDLKAGKHKIMASARIQEMNTLTEQQRDQLEKLRHKRRGEFRGHRHGGMRGPGEGRGMGPRGEGRGMGPCGEGEGPGGPNQQTRL